VELRDFRRDSYNGFGEGLARAFELAFTPAIFAGIGLGIDSLIGTVPVFTIALLVFAFVGMFVRMWFGYDHAMQRHESKVGNGSSAPAETAPAPAEVRR